MTICTLFTKKVWYTVDFEALNIRQNVKLVNMFPSATASSPSGRNEMMTRFDLACMAIESRYCPETLQYLRDLKASHDRMRHALNGLVSDQHEHSRDCICPWCDAR